MYDWKAPHTAAPGAPVPSRGCCAATCYPHHQPGSGILSCKILADNSKRSNLLFLSDARGVVFLDARFVPGCEGSGRGRDKPLVGCTSCSRRSLWQGPQFPPTTKPCVVEDAPCPGLLAPSPALTRNQLQADRPECGVKRGHQKPSRCVVYFPSNGRPSECRRALHVLLSSRAGASSSGPDILRRLSSAVGRKWTYSIAADSFISGGIR